MSQEREPHASEMLFRVQIEALMTTALQRYRARMDRMLRERELAGGALLEQDESEHVALLDRSWWEMTAEEQEQIERELTGESASEAPR